MSYKKKTVYICNVCNKEYSTPDEADECCDEKVFDITAIKILDVHITVSKGHSVNFYSYIIFDAAVLFYRNNRMYTVCVNFDGREGDISLITDPVTIVALFEDRMNESEFKHILDNTLTLQSIFEDETVQEVIFCDNIVKFMDRNCYNLMDPVISSIDWSKNEWFSEEE